MPDMQKKGKISYVRQYQHCIRQWYGELKHIRSNDGFEHVLIDIVTQEGFGAIMAFITGCEEIATAYPDYVSVDDELT